MTSDYVTRIARALYEVSPETDGGEYVDGFRVSKPSTISWSVMREMNAEGPYLALALAALSAAMEPDEAMIEAGLWDHPNSDPARIFRAMIKRALERRKGAADA
jgi:hypothetical protein